MARYELDQRFIDENRDAIARKEPIEVNLRDNTTMEWRYVKAVVSSEPIEGAEEVNVMVRSGVAAMKYYVKVLEDLSGEEGELQGFYEPGQCL